MSVAHAPVGAVDVSERSVAIAHLARRGTVAEMEERLQIPGTRLPEGPRLVHAGSIRLLGISPGRWLAISEPADPDFAADLAAQLKPAAAVCDQSDAYVVLRLRGAAARPMLAKLVAIDLHERTFAVGHAAATIAAHVSVLLWRMPDEDGPVFELAVPRSYSTTFREALQEASAAVGGGSSR